MTASAAPDNNDSGTNDDNNNQSSPASATASAEGVSGSPSHSNLLALLDAASRVDTLPVPAEAEGQNGDQDGGEGQDEADKNANSAATSASAAVATTCTRTGSAVQTLPKTNALTAEMVRELTAQKAAALSAKGALTSAPSSGSPTGTAHSTNSSTCTRSSPSLSPSTCTSKVPSTSKKSSQAKFPKPRRPKLPISTAQPRLAGSAPAPTSAGSSTTAGASTSWAVTNHTQTMKDNQDQQDTAAYASPPHAAPAPTPTTFTYRKIKAPKPIKLEPIVKETFPVVLYRVLMKGIEGGEEDEGEGEGEGEGEPSSSTSAAGENPSEQPSSNNKKKGYDDIVHWLPEGTHFVIVDTERFVTEVMAKEFGVSQKLTSFTRRLSRWGFQQVRVPGYAQHMAFCHPKFRRGDKDSAATIKSVQAEQGAKNVAQARRLNTQQPAPIGVGVGVGAGVGTAYAQLQGHDPFNHSNPRGQPPIIMPAPDAPPGALTGALAAATHGVGLGVDPIVAARLRAAAALEVEEETLRIQHLERQLHLQQAQNQAATAVTNPYDGYVGVGAGAPHTGLQSLAARNAASALTRRYSGTGSSLAATEHAAAAVAPTAAGTPSYGQSLADIHYAQAARGLPLNAAAAAASAAPATQEPTAAAGAGDVDLSLGPPSIFGTGSQIYEQSSPLEREIMLQARYKHLLGIQATLQRKALVSQQHQLHLEEQQYLAAHQQPHAALTAAAGVGVGAAGHGQLLPQHAVDSATQHVLAGAAAVMQRDSLLAPGAAGPGAPAPAGYHYPHA